MQIMLYEAKKIFVHKRGLLFVVIYVTLLLLSLVLFDTPQNADMENKKTEYSAYIRTFQGECTPEKERSIENEFQRIDTANIALQNLYNDYYNGKEAEESFENKAAALEYAIKNASGFDVIYRQYIYIRENPINRYFVYTNGWNALLANGSLDIFLVLLILLIIAPVFCYEYESSMDALLLSIRRGGTYQAIRKIAFTVIVVTCLCLLGSGVKYGFYVIKYGLQGGEYPLQSLAYFASSTWNISLRGAFALTLGLKIIGYLFFSAIVLVVSKITRKYAITVFFCTALTTLPYYGINASWVKYFIPLPLGFMTASGYLRGSEYERDMFTDELTTAFKEIPKGYFVCLLIVVILCTVLLLALTVLRSKNKWGEGRRNRHVQSVSVILIACAMVAGLGGCAVDDAQRGIFNHSTRMNYENDRYTVFSDDSDIDDIRLLIRDKDSGVVSDLIRDPFRGSARVSSAIYGDGDFIYYFKLGIDESKLRSIPDKIYVVEIDLRNFNERVIFENTVNPYRDSFLGLFENTESESQLPMNCDALFVNDKYIYIVSNEIYQFDRITYASKALPIPINRSFAFDGAFIWYINHKGEIVKYDTHTKNELVLPDIVTTCFYLDDAELFFVNRLDKYNLYSLNLKTGKTKMIKDMEMLYFYCDSEYIYFQGFEDYTLYRMDKAGGEYTVAPCPPYRVQV